MPTRILEPTKKNASSVYPQRKVHHNCPRNAHNTQNKTKNKQKQELLSETPNKHLKYNSIALQINRHRNMACNRTAPAPLYVCTFRASLHALYTSYSTVHVCIQPTAPTPSHAIRNTRPLFPHQKSLLTTKHAPPPLTCHEVNLHEVNLPPPTLHPRGD